MPAVLTILVLAVVVIAAVKAAKQPKTQVRGYVRCPTCGAKAPVRGNTWECGYCCDSGSVGNRQVYK